MPGFAGGYIGVDVFFVVSGYLISSILLREPARKPDFLSFYERRIRRLFPALFVLLIFCTITSIVLLLPVELDRFGLSIASTGLFVPNFFFWRHAAYFAPISENAPSPAFVVARC